jgi:hypothetical protein
MMPARKGNRHTSLVDNQKTKALGWSPQRSLPEYISRLKLAQGSVSQQQARVLVFSTTFFPDAGNAEYALTDLMEAMPSVHFDVITTRFSRVGAKHAYERNNVTVHRVGFGNVFDKYLLPLLGARVARTLVRKHAYIFMWSLFASYGALTALATRGRTKLPLLITIADQKLGNIPRHTRIILGHILGGADQVYADDTEGTRTAISLSRRTSLVRAIGEGDTFANQIRFAYSNFLKKRTDA